MGGYERSGLITVFGLQRPRFAILLASCDDPWGSRKRMGISPRAENRILPSLSVTKVVTEVIDAGLAELSS